MDGARKHWLDDPAHGGGRSHLALIVCSRFEIRRSPGHTDSGGMVPFGSQSGCTTLAPRRITFHPETVSICLPPGELLR